MPSTISKGLTSMDLDEIVELPLFAEIPNKPSPEIALAINTCAANTNGYPTAW